MSQEMCELLGLIYLLTWLEVNNLVNSGGLLERTYEVSVV
jgi:hypothetical protein